MQLIEPQKLEANGFYWARRKPSASGLTQPLDDLEIVQISTIFGSAFEFWTVAIIGSEQHYTLDDFEFLRRIQPLASPTELHVSRSNVAGTTTAFNH